MTRSEGGLLADAVSVVEEEEGYRHESEGEEGKESQSPLSTEVLEHCPGEERERESIVVTRKSVCYSMRNTN